jgi:hypothetical protein
MFKRGEFLRITIDRNDIVTSVEEAERHGTAEAAPSARHHSAQAGHTFPLETGQLDRHICYDIRAAALQMCQYR